MKVKFDAYLLWPLAKNFQNWIVDRSTARNFRVLFLTLKVHIWWVLGKYVRKFEISLKMLEKTQNFCIRKFVLMNFVQHKFEEGNISEFCRIWNNESKICKIRVQKSSWWLFFQLLRKKYLTKKSWLFQKNQLGLGFFKKSFLADHTHFRGETMIHFSPSDLVFKYHLCIPYFLI